ncbi:MAG: hypothetical protein GXO48_03045 [Chlorobi bacterium]|nr:hypothetical protein [Chlorobiota bacterium]
MSVWEKLMKFIIRQTPFLTTIIVLIYSLLITQYFLEIEAFLGVKWLSINDLMNVGLLLFTTLFVIERAWIRPVSKPLPSLYYIFLAVALMGVIVLFIFNISHSVDNEYFSIVSRLIWGIVVFTIALEQNAKGFLDVLIFSIVIIVDLLFSFTIAIISLLILFSIGYITNNKALLSGELLAWDIAPPSFSVIFPLLMVYSVPVAIKIANAIRNRLSEYRYFKRMVIKFNAVVRFLILTIFILIIANYVNEFFEYKFCHRMEKIISTLYPFTIIVMIIPVKKSIWQKVEFAVSSVLFGGLLSIVLLGYFDMHCWNDPKFIYIITSIVLFPIVYLYSMLADSSQKKLMALNVLLILQCIVALCYSLYY